MRMQYAEAVAALGNRESRKAGNHTYWKRREHGDIAYQLHETDVVTFHPDNTATLTSGGWMTNTTRDRMSVAASIGQRARVWYINGDTLYFDGVRIDLATGAVINPRDLSAEQAETDAMRKAIAKYVAGFTVEWARDLFGVDTMPSNVASHMQEAMEGDCWFCLMHETETQQALGDATGDTDHLISHMEEGYRPLSLVWNAYREVPYGDARFVFALDMSGLVGGNHKWSIQSVHKNVREYLYRRLVSGISVRPAQAPAR